VLRLRKKQRVISILKTLNKDLYMKKLLVLSLLLIASSWATAQCTIYKTDRAGASTQNGKSDGKIVYTTDAKGEKASKIGKVDGTILYSTDRKGATPVQKGKIENGVVYSTDRFGTNAVKVGKVEKGTVYSTDSYGLNVTIVGKVEGDCEAAGALLLLLIK
jgi:hypothetical protein